MIRVPRNLIAATAAWSCAIIAGGLYAQPIELTVNSAESSITFTILGNSDSSSLSGTGIIELTPPGEPFETAQIQALELTIADGFSIGFLGGLVSASAEPGVVSVTLINVGPPGVVDSGGQFDQPGNEAALAGSVEIFDPLNLAGGTGTLLLDGITGPVDIIDAAVDAKGIALTVGANINLELPVTDTINIIVDGSAVLTGKLPPPVLGDVNCDGAVDLDDVDPFVKAIASSTYLDKADINGDLLVNLLDVDPFVAILAGP